MSGSVAGDTPSVSLSFANNFWGKEDAGVDPLLDRMHSAKVTSEELKDFYHARAQIEEEYAKKILNLARKPLGSTEAGTLKMSLDVVRAELESTGKAHQAIAGQMKQELEEPLAALAGGLKERRKIIQTGIEKLLNTKIKQTNTVNKARDRYEQDCLKIKGYLAQGHMVMGQEERKNKAKLEKTQVQMSATSQEYEQAVKVLEETTGRWNREWKAACDKFQDLEEERLDFTKSSLWSFANITSTVCVSDDASCEKIRLSLEDCDVEKDISAFIKDKGTGQEIPDPPKYINFCRGDIPDNVSEVSDDGAYSVAQFARQMNPAFRSSSPQPSTYSSHHDPASALAQHMALDSRRSMSSNRMPSEDPVPMPNDLRSSVNSQHQQNDFRQSGQSQYQTNDARRPSQPHVYQPNEPRRPSQAQQVPSHPYGDIPTVPHNEYPMEGMTQFCRLAAPSDRSSNPSPTRQDEDSHSDYSNPTSFSSFDPASGHTSPTKQFNGSDLSSAPSERPPLEKKKSSFFQNRSPFGRRKSKHEIQPPQLASAAVTPTQRNTWAAPAPRPATSASPTRPFGREPRNVGFGKPTPSPEPDPADPRANFQLNIGNNVFDVASPDARKRPQPQKEASGDDLDPIAQALAELKGVTKQASTRISADRYAGMSTPAPSASPRPGAGRASPLPMNADFRAAQRGTPPPQYDQPPVSRLGAPRPAHTSRQMQQTTASYIGQKRDMFDARPSTGVDRRSVPAPRSTSPAPLRSTSPRPYMNSPQQQQPYRATSPNPYQQGPPGNRPRANSTSPLKQQPNYGGYNSHAGSPAQGMPRSASPNPMAAQGRPGQGMPRSASPNPMAGHGRGSSMGRPTSSNGNAMVLAPAGDGRGPSGAYDGTQRKMRPTSQYYGAEGGWAAASTAGSPQGGASPGAVSTRVRGQSSAGNRPMTKDGRAILNYSRAVYMYSAAIPEELSFTKNDILAVLRLQDDGWWEAEHKNGKRGLVPSNYLVPV